MSNTYERYFCVVHYIYENAMEDIPERDRAELKKGEAFFSAKHSSVETLIFSEMVKLVFGTETFLL